MRISAGDRQKHLVNWITRANDYHNGEAAIAWQPEGGQDSGTAPLLSVQPRVLGPSQAFYVEWHMVDRPRSNNTVQRLDGHLRHTMA